ncbi:MAG: potassium transporter TrkG [Pricia sp.]
MWNKLTLSNLALLFLDLILIVFLVYDFGFKNLEEFRQYKIIVLPSLVIALMAFNLYKYRIFRQRGESGKIPKINLIYLSFLLVLETVLVLANSDLSFTDALFKQRYILEAGLLFYFLTRLSLLLRKFYGLYFNPAILFVGSFGLIALVGTFMLMLPAATTNGISFIDALFTATSATAVTGLIVVDTAVDFTYFGQTVIMVLFQLGGLGMLTFTSFFAYFFKTGASYRESLYMQNILGHDRLGGVMARVMQIVVFSLVIEAIGAMLIYFSLSSEVTDEKGFFAVFHAISAYCNAGFSLATDGLYDSGLRFNYFMQWVVMVLIVFGGLGYHIAYNVTQYLRRLALNIFAKGRKKFIARVVLLNTKITIVTTAILLTVGTVFFSLSEQATILSGHSSIFGKFTTSLFASVTARTAGFNTVDMTDFTIPGILFMIFLMWIGASPASTGGGIKTTTFALATLNIFTVARDSPHIEIGTRRIASDAVKRAFAIISISLAIIGTGILLLLIFNPEFTLIQIAFEVFSAYSTVGLSLGITSALSENSKYVIIFVMFIGRIGLLNLMIGLLRSVNQSAYQYPEENIMIN